MAGIERDVEARERRRPRVARATRSARSTTRDWQAVRLTFREMQDEVILRSSRSSGFAPPLARP